MAKKIEAKKVQKEFSGWVIATAPGQYQGSIVPTGKKFLFKCKLRVNGELPLWVEECEPEAVREKSVPRSRTIASNKKGASADSEDLDDLV